MSSTTMDSDITLENIAPSKLLNFCRKQDIINFVTIIKYNEIEQRLRTSLGKSKVNLKDVTKNLATRPDFIAALRKSAIGQEAFSRYNVSAAGTFMLAQNPIQVPGSLVEDNTSFCFHFCKNLVNLPQFNRSTDRVYVINYSVGQTFVNPDPPGGVNPIFNSWSPQIAGGLYASLIQVVQAAKASLATDGGLQLAALLWHQGEADSTFPETGDTYLFNLKHVLDRIRVDLNVPTLSIVGGTLGPLANLRRCER